MYRMDITYTDFDGNQRSEAAYFNLNKSELLKWMTTTGDYTMDQVLVRLSEERNGRKIIEMFESLVDLAYGKKSIDGRRFSKSPEILADFKETPAYDQLFMELCTNADKAAEFINKIIPADLAAEAAKIIAEHPEGVPAGFADYTGGNNAAQPTLMPLFP